MLKFDPHCPFRRVRPPSYSPILSSFHPFQLSCPQLDLLGDFHTQLFLYALKVTNYFEFPGSTKFLFHAAEKAQSRPSTPGPDPWKSATLPYTFYTIYSTSSREGYFHFQAVGHILVVVIGAYAFRWLKSV
jgi:hypothetical protein